MSEKVVLQLVVADWGLQIPGTCSVHRARSIGEYSAVARRASTEAVAGCASRSRLADYRDFANFISNAPPIEKINAFLFDKRFEYTETSR